MKVVTLLGSAKKKGNTATVLGWVEEELQAAGHTVERVYLHNKTINGCLGCAKCRDYPDDIACIQKDDAEGIMEQMIAADSVLFASPLYFWGFTAQIKALIDRGYALVTNYHQPSQTSLMKGKRVGLLATGLPFNFLALLGFLSLIGMIIKNSIVLVDEINIQTEAGLAPFDAVLSSGTSRLRPVAMAAAMVVPMPMNGSRTVSPLAENMLIKR